MGLIYHYRSPIGKLLLDLGGILKRGRIDEGGDLPKITQFCFRLSL
ncbi:MAG: hypothetical protein J7525_12195 [Roseofilum sp. SID3]|nr:hypothetical protein [Roseofilum sp. SID1]MBP0013856.1 hypothetical protein [Roseofilum sp. SID3]